jgi:hypothetical protein
MMKDTASTDSLKNVAKEMVKKYALAQANNNPQFKGMMQHYDIVYKWFDLLKVKGHRIIGYVIMPNHLHALIAFMKSNISINTRVGNAKRFMAYEIVKRLQANDRHEILTQLEQGNRIYEGCSDKAKIGRCEIG